jgi:hypothetical protein
LTKSNVEYVAKAIKDVTDNLWTKKQKYLIWQLKFSTL